MSIDVGLNTRDATRIVAQKSYTFAINGTGSATAVGNLLCYATSTAGAGKTVVQPATAILSTFAGVALDAVADGEVVKIQTKGYCPAVSMLGHASLSAGDILVPTDGEDYASYSSAADGSPAFIIAAEAYTTTSAAATKAAFLYCGY